MLYGLKKLLTMSNIVYGLACCASIILSYHIYEGAFNLRFSDERKLHSPRTVSRNELSQLAGLTNESYFKEVLQKIMVPRIVGTPSHESVKEYIGSELASLGYNIEYDAFEDVTPNFGKLKFTNIIARLDPEASRFLTLSCHYDSKYFKDFVFLGATDSAVPCAMMIHLAKVLTPYIKTSNPRVSLMLVFFDGEEAFDKWSDTDSLYGSRNLANKWSQIAYPTRDARTTHLHRMDMLVLLDLLGTKDTKFYSFFPETERWHRHLSQIEKKLKASSLIPSRQPLHFLEKSTFGMIEDDHIPFLRRDVPVLHIIPARFPAIWHTEKDDYSALDFPTIDTLNKVLQVFTYSYIMGDLNTN